MKVQNKNLSLENIRPEREKREKKLSFKIVRFFTKLKEFFCYHNYEIVDDNNILICSKCNKLINY